MVWAVVGMADPICHEFQEAVGRNLARHRSVLDVMSKLQEAASRTNRAVVKAVTNCGCIKVNADKQQVPADVNYRELARHMQTHLDGRLCDSCRDVIESEIGLQLLYLAGLCEVLGLKMGDVLERERDRLTALGPFYFC